MNVLNKKEIAVFGIRRSGNSAIIGWLMRHMGSRAIHLNDVAGESPYDSCSEVRAKQLSLWRCKPKINHALKNFRSKDPVTYARHDPAVNWGYIRSFSPKDCLIVSYQNRFLDDPDYAAYVSRHDHHVGCSQELHHVVVLRDAFNLFASLCRNPSTTPEDIAAGVCLYKQYAELFLDAVRQKQQNIICVNYNKWVSSRLYRSRLARRFGVELDSKPERNTSSNGAGHRDSAGKRERLSATDSWQVNQHDPSYRAIFKDRRLVELSESVFGRVASPA